MALYFQSSVTVQRCLGTRRAVTMRAFSGAASSRLMLSIKEYFLHVTIVNGDRSWYLLLAGRCHAVSIAIPIAAEVKFNPGTLTLSMD